MAMFISNLNHVQMFMFNVHVQYKSCSSDLLCPDVKVMIPNDLGSLSSEAALEKIFGNPGVVNFVIKCSDDHHVTLMLHIQAFIYRP